MKDILLITTKFITSVVAIIDKNFTPQLSLKHIQKDLRLAVEMADMYDQPLQVAASVNEVSLVHTVPTVLVEFLFH